MAKSRDRSASPPPRVIDIGNVPEKSLTAARALPARPGIPHKIGFSRGIPELADANSAATGLQWQSTRQGGLIAAVSVRSRGALGVRLGILVGRMPDTATLRFYAQNGDAAAEVPGQRVVEAVKRNLEAGDTTDEGRTYWSPRVDGDEITLELELPPGIAAEQLAFAVPRILHIYRALAPAAAAQAPVASNAGSGTCEIDVSCYLPAWSAESNATALMQFVDAGAGYLCTGTLLNTIPASYIPYFLSAAHCISNQSAASTLETIWFYRSTSCNSGTANPNTATVGGGATLLYANTSTDTSFMWLNGAPPAGASFAGWDPGTPSLNVAATGIHNPLGDLQKISLGNTASFDSCAAAGGDSFSCGPANQATANHINVAFSTGVTEQGSSGSGIFTSNNASGAHYLIGQLHGGTDSCSNMAGSSEYGRFDLAYNAALAHWLKPAAVDALAVAAAGNGAGTITSAPGGIECGTTCRASFPPSSRVTLVATPATGSVFTGWGGACSGNAASCTLAVNASTSVSATFLSQTVVPQTGYWWNPAELGNGFVIEIQQSSMFMAGFLYAANSTPTWVASNGPMTSPTQYSGSLITYVGGQTLTGPFKAATQGSRPLGSIGINFSSASTGTLTWPGGSIPIQRFDFGPGGSSAKQPVGNPQSGWWWNPAEGGRGYAVEVQGGAMYLAAYMYDALGNPIWYLATGNMTGASSYQGAWQQFGGGQTLTGTYQAPSVVNPDVGSVTLQFASPTAATLTLPDGRQIPLQRFTFDSSPYSNLAGTWSGNWLWQGPASNGCAVTDSGTLTMTLAQSGADVWGSNVNATGVNSVNPDCSQAGAGTASNGVATGVVSGASVNLSFDLQASGGGVLSFTGNATLSGNTLTGSIVRSTGGSGSLTLTRQ